MFKDNLSTMTVSDGETTETFKDMVFIQQMEWTDGTFYLAFREQTPQEKILAAINANSESVTDLQMALAEVYVLNIRKGAGTNYGTNGAIRDKGVYTIVAEANGQGATKWGKLKSGAGWISLDYTKKV